MVRPRPRTPGKPNPSQTGYQQQTPPQEANARQMVPSQLSQMGARSEAAKKMLGRHSQIHRLSDADAGPAHS